MVTRCDYYFSHFNVFAFDIADGEVALALWTDPHVKDFHEYRIVYRSKDGKGARWDRLEFNEGLFCPYTRESEGKAWSKKGSYSTITELLSKGYPEYTPKVNLIGKKISEGMVHIPTVFPQATPGERDQLT